MVKVCHLTTVHKWNDIRIFEKQCTFLASAGFDTHLIATNTNEKKVNNVTIHSVFYAGGRSKRITQAAKQLYKKALKVNASIYHFHDPELMWVGVKLSLKGKKVIYDVHEDVPKQMLDKKWLGIPFTRFLMSWLFRIVQWFCCLFYSGIVGATPEVAKRFNKRKKIVVYNHPIITYLQNAKPIEIKKDKPAIVYAGGLTKIRGIKELIIATGKLQGKAQLWLIGPWENEAFQNECEQVDGYQFTRYFGSMSIKEVYQYYKMADIGAHTVYPSERHLIGIPTKILECMAIEMPVIITESIYWRSFFENNAVFTDALNPNDIAEKIEMMLTDIDKTKTMAASAKKLVLEKYTWEKEFNKLLNLYNSLSLK